MGYKKTDLCLEKAHDDERLFVLMTRDYTSPKIVIEWIKENLTRQPKEKLREAFECALEMNDRFIEFTARKEYEKKGWIFCQKELPYPGSECAVLFSDFTEGDLTYWSNEEGFDAQTEPHHLEVVAWMNPVRAF